MKLQKLSAFCLAVLFSCVVSSAAIFKSPPKITRVADGCQINFTVDEPIDAEVAVLDDNGIIVRHLAAGMLTASGAPAAPFKAGLTQSLIWDGKNDVGQKINNAAKIRVRLGIKPEFERVIGYNPAAMETVRSMATGPDGTLYLHTTTIGFGRGSSHGRILAFDRAGNYLRTVAPYPANLTEDKLAGIKRLTVVDNIKAPFINNAETRSIIPGIGGEAEMHRFVVTPDNRLIFSGIHGILRTSMFCRLISINSDGSIPSAGILGPAFGRTVPPSLAISPDGKTIYATGIDRGTDTKPKLANAVFTMNWGNEEPKSFISNGLEKPNSLAVDKKGCIYVADKGHNRIAVFKDDGALLGELKVNQPDRVEVDPSNGTIYVLGGDKINELQKFSDWHSEKPVAQINLPTSKYANYTALMALDATKSPSIIWVTTTKSRYAGFKVLRIEDGGEKFSEPQELTKMADNNSPSAIRPYDLISHRDNLYVWAQKGEKIPQVFNALTGEAIKNPPRPKKTIGVTVGFLFDVGHDGNSYVSTGWPKVTLARFKNDFEPYPFQKGLKGEVPEISSPRTRLRGICADANGNVYILRQTFKEEDDENSENRGVTTPYSDANNLAKISPEGSIVNERLIHSDIRGLNSVRTDPAGNIYLLLGARAGDNMLPTWLNGQVSSTPEDPAGDLGYNYYPLMYGTILKFPPSGGEIRLAGDGLPAGFTYKRKVYIKGAEWHFFGASCVPSWTHGGMKPDICMCESPRFDVDGFGRSFFGDACAFRVGILDSAGNLILWFGEYGNQDSAGPESAIPTPAIPIGWVQAIMVKDDAVFIGDRLNERVVKVNLNAAVTETIKLP